MTAFTQYMILSKSATKRMKTHDPEGYRTLRASFLREVHQFIDDLRDEMQLRRLRKERGKR